MTKRVALYLRVSTGEQTVENQQQALEAWIQQRGYHIVATFVDNGISGSKGRDMRPGLDAALKAAVRGEFDCVLGMYHDQALGPLKLHAFGRAANVTLGLPLVRTSVDHGTAFDIAGRGVADLGSLEEAIRLAAELVRNEGRAASRGSAG